MGLSAVVGTLGGCERIMRPQRTAAMRKTAAERVKAKV
jgi:hypothetical protein